MAKTTDASRSAREGQETYFAVSFPLTLANCTAASTQIVRFPIFEHCRAAYLVTTVTTVASTANRGCTLQIQSVKQCSAADTAIKTPVFSQLVLTTSSCNALGETNYSTIPIETAAQFEPGDGLNIYVKEIAAGGAFAQGAVICTVVFARRAD